MRKVLLLGATGRIGGIVLKNLLGKDADIRVYVRTPEKLSREAAERVEVIKGDALDAVSLHQAMSGIDIVIAAVNGNLLAQAESIVKAMVGTSVSRVMWVTGMGIHHEVPGATGRMLDMLVRSQPEYVQAADLIAESGVPYTLIRAAHLTDGKNEKYYIQHEGDRLHSNSVDRCAVARFITDMVENEKLGFNESLGVTN